MSFMEMSLQRLFVLIVVSIASLVCLKKAYDGLIAGFVTVSVSGTRYGNEMVEGADARRVGLYYLLGALVCVGVIVWGWRTREEDLDP